MYSPSRIRGEDGSLIAQPKRERARDALRLMARRIDEEPQEE